jgi:hypothetical protein
MHREHHFPGLFHGTEEFKKAEREQSLSEQEWLHYRLGYL